MPQDTPKEPRSAADRVDFDAMLNTINWLFLGTPTLILVDLSFLSRFWTQFEAYLAMQAVTSAGLKPAERRRSCHVVHMHNAKHLPPDTLFDMWSAKSVQEAYQMLAEDDVLVTNTRDKETQLRILNDLDEQIKQLSATVRDAHNMVEMMAERDATLTNSDTRSHNSGLQGCTENEGSKGPPMTALEV